MTALTPEERYRVIDLFDTVANYDDAIHVYGHWLGIPQCILWVQEPFAGKGVYTLRCDAGDSFLVERGGPSKLTRLVKRIALARGLKALPATLAAEAMEVEVMVGKREAYPLRWGDQAIYLNPRQVALVEQTTTPNRWEVVPWQTFVDDEPGFLALAIRDDAVVGVTTPYLMEEAQ